MAFLGWNEGWTWEGGLVWKDWSEDQQMGCGVGEGHVGVTAGRVVPGAQPGGRWMTRRAGLGPLECSVGGMVVPNWSECVV